MSFQPIFCPFFSEMTYVPLCVKVFCQSVPFPILGVAKEPSTLDAAIKVVHCQYVIYRNKTYWRWVGFSLFCLEPASLNKASMKFPSLLGQDAPTASPHSTSEEGT